MSESITRSKMAGHSSVGHPCSDMSGHTPTGTSWSTARTRSAVTPLVRMISMAMAASPSVWDTSGDRFSVQLMNRARRSEKSTRSAGTSPSASR